MKKLHIIFSHGKESGPWGSKISKMAEIHSIDYQDLQSPDDRVQRLLEFIKKLKGEIILVGSSMGGYVSTIASSQVRIAGLMLLAPALYLEGYDVKKPRTSCKNISIIHGWNDDIVPYQNSVKFAQQHNAKLVLVEDGHRLSNSASVLNSELERVIKRVCK